MFNEEESSFGGDDETLLMGLCRLLSLALELPLEYCLEDILVGTERCVGVIDSEPGEVDRLGPSERHSETFLERQLEGLEHSDTLLVRFDL